MKKKPKKLELHRETLAALDQRELTRADGGAYTDYGCFSGYQTCGSCQNTCTTNRC
jgi:hypothetical protein